MNPFSNRAIEDATLLVEIKQSILYSHGIYSSPRVYRDMREAVLSCSESRVAGLTREAKIETLRGYRKPRYKSDKSAIASPNRLQQQFNVSHGDVAWVKDITYIRTYEGWLYVAVLIDLYSRAVVGWSLKLSMSIDIVLDALMMALWRRQPNSTITTHTDQSSQFGRDDFQRV
jgi:putative transposase